MNKHNQIMNLPTDKMDAEIDNLARGHRELMHRMIAGCAIDGDDIRRVLELAYKLGHRDARHAAAEIAQGE